MGTQEKEPLLHWNYFLALASDLEKLSRYIEFSESNFKTHSIELAHLLLASSSEVDVVCKQICRILSPIDKAENIDSYRSVILHHLPSYPDEKVYFPRYGRSFTPWERWSVQKNPLWWKSYNNVKHQRNLYFEEANLKNVLNSMGGLLITVFYYYKLKFMHEEPNLINKNGDVIMRLQPEAEFIRLSEDYYPGRRVTRSKL